MRRIYESNALRRDDEPFSPTDPDDRRWTKALAGEHRTINWDAFSHAFMPGWLRERAITVDIETSRDRYEVGEPVGFCVTMRNRFPISVKLQTRSPVLWTWAVDGLVDAAKIDRSNPTERRSVFSFGRGERKRFERTWSQTIRHSRREWVPVDPGEYTLSAAINVPNAAERGLAAETTISIE